MKLVSIDSATELLVDKLKKGDSLAAEKLYNQYAKAMYNTLIRMTNDRMIAEDLLQESFVKAFKKIDTYKKEAAFGAWLKRIVVNSGLEYLRSKKVDFQSLEDERLPQFEAQESENITDIDQKVEQVHHAIQSLPVGTRNIVNLYLIEGYTHEEISAYLGISKSTSKTQYMRGKQLIKQKIMGS